jgi:hypothetical protein
VNTYVHTYICMCIHLEVIHLESQIGASKAVVTYGGGVKNDDVDVYHCVNAATAADHFPTRPVYPPIVECALRFRVIIIVIDSVV